MAGLALLAAILLGRFDSSTVRAAEPATPTARPLALETFASGLIHPRGLAFGPDGSLYVAEAGSGGEQAIDLGLQKPHPFGHTGRISRISQNGERTTVAEGLPSIVASFNEELGPSGLAFLGDQLYLLTASGGWEIGDPDFHSGLFRVNVDGSLERIFDYSAYTLEHPPRSRLEDPRADVPLGMPYGLAAVNGHLFTTDGNQEQILAITPDGQATRIFEYPKSNRALTGIAAGPDGALYVAEHAAMKVTRVSPDGDPTEAATKLQSPTGVAFDQAGRLYVLEYYVGRLVRAAPVGEGPHEVVATGLPQPTAMAFGPDGNLYVSTGGSMVGTRTPRDGQIVRLRLAPGPGARAPSPASTPAPWLIGLGLVAAVAALVLGFRRRSGGRGEADRGPQHAARA